MLWIKSRTMKQKRLCKILFVFLLGFPCTHAETTEASVRNTTACDPFCGCDGLYVYDSVKKGCVLDLPNLMKRVVVNYDSQSDELINQEGMSRSIYIEGQKLFKGIIISVILFITCASLCVVSACIYCCKINYSDRKLKQEVEALAKKMHKTNILKKEHKKPIDDPKAQSYSYCDTESNVYIVIMIGSPLIEFIFTTVSLIVAMMLAAIFCCIYIRLSDTWWARRQNLACQCLGKNVPRNSHEPTAKDECCTIFVPDVAIVL
ncbi:unnamed protein product [Arctia plantaginis]|uniref:Uncharacterized protein n=1 Tax=Arctia plantaginis TaxID=874455 RepID=A0A8S1B3F6_ARCPL|nr:unnamed protein product [Arctia plantaginis]